MSDQNRIDDLIIKGIDRVEDKVEKIQDKVSSINGEVKDLNSKFGQHEELFRAHLETDQKMYEEFAVMNKTLIENTQSLKEHMKRTAVLEESHREQHKALKEQHKALMEISDRVKIFEDDKLKKQAVKEYIADRWKIWLMYLGAFSTVVGIISKLTGLI